MRVNRGLTTTVEKARAALAPESKPQNKYPDKLPTGKCWDEEAYVPRSCSTCGCANKDKNVMPCRGCDLAGAPVNWEPQAGAGEDA